MARGGPAHGGTRPREVHSRAPLSEEEQREQQGLDPGLQLGAGQGLEASAQHFWGRLCGHLCGHTLLQLGAYLPSISQLALAPAGLTQGAGVGGLLNLSSPENWQRWSGRIKALSGLMINPAGKSEPHLHPSSLQQAAPELAPGLPTLP